MSKEKPFKKKSLLKLKDHKTFDEKVDRAFYIMIAFLTISFILNIII